MNKNPCDTCKNFSELMDSLEYENEQLVEENERLKLIAENTIQEQVIAGNGANIRNLLLTTDQIKLIKYIKSSGYIVASELASMKGISIQNASSKLNRLYKAKYLIRIMESAKSGGIEFVYKFIPSKDTKINGEP